MGVVITGYRQIKKENVIAGEDCPLDSETRQERHDLWRAYLSPDFPGRADDVEHRAYYSYAQAVCGLSRSYGGYGHWRNELAKLAGWTGDRDAWRASGGPMWELINFADNEGVIGAEVCAKLFRDMAQLQAKADAHPEQYFRECFNGMRAAIEAAADGGALDFS